MIWLVLGVLLWSAAHLWKRVAPAHRAGFGDAGKKIVAAATILSIVLMVIGYRAWDGTFYYGREPWRVGVNNILMVLAFYLFAAAGAKTRITRWIAHPQLTAFSAWCVAHLFVNGDTPSFVLWGGLLVWAVGEIAILSAREVRGPYHAVPVRKEFTALIAAAVAFVVVSAIHLWLGYNPFG